MPATNFSEKTVWITGASSGIGEAITYAFAKRGARLVISARRVEELERVKANCSRPDRVEIMPMDLSKVAELAEKVAGVIKSVGKIDILVNNGGISQRSEAKDTSLEVYRDIMEVNFFGTIHLSNLVMRHFLERNEGQFVIISSITGIVGLPLRTAYTASKHALEGFYRSLRTEIWKTNLRVLMVRPASIKTNIAQNALTADGGKFNKADKVIDNGISAESLAECIIRSIEKNKSVLLAGPKAQQFIIRLNRFFPGFVFNILKKVKP
ncbi:MAG: SDR family oxidoreductase [Chitinophagaceae bacterium]